MRILGIETSCDETSAAVVENGKTVFSNVIATSQSAFEQSGGVIPEEAARRQVECVIPVLHQALREAGIQSQVKGQTPKVTTIDAIAVTKGPGLLGSLLIGTTAARTLAALWKKPLIGVHHTLGHLSSTWLTTEPSTATKLRPGPETFDPLPKFPVMTLSASGGHTDLWYRTSHTRGQLLGATRDDAAGEAFDKGASLIDLPFPGGPAIARAAEGGDPHAYDFPLPLKGEDTLDFSFSGLKTALKYLMRDHGTKESGNQSNAPRLSDIAASYQHALCCHLLDRITKALERFPDAKEIHLVGGVSANRHLRDLVSHACLHMTIRTPATLTYCTDNAAMIAAAGFFLVQTLGNAAYQKFETEASIPLQEIVE